MSVEEPATQDVHLLVEIAIPYYVGQEEPRDAAIEVLDDLRNMGYSVTYHGYHTAVPWGKAVGGRA